MNKTLVASCPIGINAAMMDGYRVERNGLTARPDSLKAAIAEVEKESSVDIRELDSAIAHEPIEKIVAHHHTKMMGNDAGRLTFIVAS